MFLVNEGTYGAEACLELSVACIQFITAFKQVVIAYLMPKETVDGEIDK